MNQLRSTPEMQSLGDREKRPYLTKLHFIYPYLPTLSQMTKQTIELIRVQSPLIACGAKHKANNTKERTKEHEVQFLAEANVTPRIVARFGYADRQRFSGAPLSREVAPRLRSGLPATNAFAGRPTRGYARQVQCRSHGNATAC